VAFSFLGAIGVTVSRWGRPVRFRERPLEADNRTNRTNRATLAGAEAPLDRSTNR